MKIYEWVTQQNVENVFSLLVSWLFCPDWLVDNNRFSRWPTEDFIFHVFKHFVEKRLYSQAIYFYIYFYLVLYIKTETNKGWNM